MKASTNRNLLNEDLRKTETVDFVPMLKALIARSMKYDDPDVEDSILRNRAGSLFTTMLKDAVNYCNGTARSNAAGSTKTLKSHLRS